jgi:hypothetical protein
MKTSFYIDKEARDLISSYIRNFDSVNALARNWATTKRCIEIIETGGVVIENNLPVELDRFLNSLPNYLETYKTNHQLAQRSFIDIEQSLRNHLEVN